MSDSLQPRGLQPARLLCPWNSPGKNTGVGSCSLPQGIFPTQGSNPGPWHCRQILYHLTHHPFTEACSCSMRVWKYGCVHDIFHLILTLLIWKQFKALKPFGFLIVTSSCQAHSCLRATAFTVPHCLDHSSPRCFQGNATQPLSFSLRNHLLWPPLYGTPWCSSLFLSFFFFGPGIEPVPLAVKTLGPNHWTSREFPFFLYFFPST